VSAVLWLWCAAALVAGAIWGAEQIAPQEPAQTVAIVGVGATQAGPPLTDRERWAVDILAGVGNAQPTAGIVGFVVAWSCAEDSGRGALARHNALNTTQSGFNETHAINGDGVRGYASYDDGLAATLQTLSYGYYTEIVAGLQTNDPARALTGLLASPWAASQYGGGASWPHGGC
jgi:hypothetical protein